MGVKARPMITTDVPAVARLWEEYVPQTQFAKTLPVSIRIAEKNLSRSLLNANVISIVCVDDDDAVTSFLQARVDYWIFNDNPFLAEVALYPGKQPTNAAGLKLLLEMDKILKARGVDQSVVSFYSGLEQEKMRELLTTMGYTDAGLVMKRGV